MILEADPAQGRYLTVLRLRLNFDQMVKRVTGLFLCVLTLLAFQARGASKFSICLDPASSCCSTVESHCCDLAPADCCDLAPTDCCIEVPGSDTQFPLPSQTEPINAPLIGEVEPPATSYLSPLPGDLFQPDFSGPDPPLPAGRILLTFVQSYLI